MNLLFLSYNNYFNRIVKKEDTSAAYVAATTKSAWKLNIDFDPKDGVDTEQIVNWASAWSPDYLVCCEGVNYEIKHRWFVVEWERLRGKQYRAVLHRDVVVDNYSEIISAPCYIEKATINKIGNKLIFNSEGFDVNQIKTDEKLIKDRSGVAWVVGYLSSKTSTDAHNLDIKTISINSSGQASGSTLFTAAAAPTDMYLSINGSTYRNGQSGIQLTFNITTGFITWNINNSIFANQTAHLYASWLDTLNVQSNNYKLNIPADNTRNHLEDAPYDMFAIPYGTIHLRSANINTTKEVAMEIAMEIAKDIGSQFIYDIQLVPYCPYLDMIVSGEISESLGVQYKDYSYIYDNTLQTKSICLFCKKSSGTILINEPDLVVNRPYESVRKTLSGFTTYFNNVSNFVTARIQDDSLKTDDVESIEYEGVVFTKLLYTDRPTNCTFTQNKTSGILNISYSGTNFPTGSMDLVAFNIGYTIKDYDNPEYIDYKVSNECDMYRLVSPNYNGQFEFSVAKNYGVSGYDVDYTYKPFQPYIHVVPAFVNAGMYGGDFNDARGLICGGDFSLPIISDAWTNYQVQNKTYQEMFDRQIQNMDVKNVIGGEQAAISMVTGTITGAASGAVAGGKMGGGYGAAAGAIIGGGASLAGGIADYSNTLKMQEENRSYAIDMYNYSLQNIQALPYTLTKVSAFNANNKIFPMVEYFTCTEKEKKSLIEKLKYNGMSVRVLDKIQTFLQPDYSFVKGEIIRLPGLEDDSHMAYEIFNEIKKGVYIK